MPAAIFLDRDGTIIVDKHYLGDPQGVELEVGAAEGLAAMAAVGMRLVGITNQSGIARGMFDLAAAERVNDRVDELLALHGVVIERWYICPHEDITGCDCRKPAPGLAIHAAEDLGIELSRTFVIGDKLSDVDLATAIGGQGILVLTGKGQRLALEAAAKGHMIAVDLKEAAKIIVDQRLWGSIEDA